MVEVMVMMVMGLKVSTSHLIVIMMMVVVVVVVVVALTAMRIDYALILLKLLLLFVARGRRHSRSRPDRRCLVRMAHVSAAVCGQLDVRVRVEEDSLAQLGRAYVAYAQCECIFAAAHISSMCLGVLSERAAGRRLDAG